MREFEQMEMQFFVVRDEEMEWFNPGENSVWNGTSPGLGDAKYRYHDHEKLAHYANAATDIEFEMPFRFKKWKYPQPYGFRPEPARKYSGRNAVLWSGTE